jgi:hypothetical protein
MFVTRALVRAAVPAAVCVATLALMPSPAQATIHPIVQSINCAAAAAFAHAPVANPPGQTPDALTEEIITVEFPFLTVSFPEPLEFSQSDFRALQATGFIDEVVMNADGMVTALVVDLRNVPQAVSGQGGEHC